jgi:hypothetical protein
MIRRKPPTLGAELNYVCLALTKYTGFIMRSTVHVTTGDLSPKPRLKMFFRGSQLTHALLEIKYFLIR